MAEVAGPGAYSRRTDLGYTGRQAAMDIPAGGNYGDRAAMQQLQTSAPMSASSEVQLPLMPQRQINASSQRPNEPITTGSPFGAGAGPEVLPTFAPAPDETATTIRALAAIYPDPDLQRLVQQLASEGR